MSFCGDSVRRMCLGLLAAIALVGAPTAISLALPSAASATILDFCGKTYGGNEYCNQGHDHSIYWIEAQASADAFCVMRATEGWAGAPSASGNEYCASAESGGYVFQEFFGYSGYAQTHNKHSYSVSASPAFEFS
jgi:hypothetical protein